MKSPIGGKVAKVLSSREVAINLGAHDGVQVGMAFAVMNPKGDDIKDPDTNELLGSVVLPKIRVWVSQVHDKVSVATTIPPGSGLHLGPIARLLLPAGLAMNTGTFRRDNSRWEDIDEVDSFVKAGDPVVQVVEGPRPLSDESRGNGQPALT